MDGEIAMSTSVIMMCAALMAVSGAVMLVNLLGARLGLFDYWNLDDEDETKPSKLDVFRTDWAFGVAATVFGVTGATFIWMHGM